MNFKRQISQNLPSLINKLYATCFYDDFVNSLSVSFVTGQIMLTVERKGIRYPTNKKSHTYGYIKICFLVNKSREA